ncbi:MAG: insulinase family protein [Bacteroidales bacterium]|nr:insulinase family protein [Bacteroidales bacterium]
MEFEVYTFQNGIRLVHKRVDSPVAHCGVIIETGSRDEKDNEHGMAHLIEHLLFKGTSKRRAYHILSRMEDVGSEINAYTTKEETCIYSTFFKDYYRRALELMSDVIFNSVYPDREIEKEKDVIIDEINSCKDSPYDLIFDEFEELAFDGNSIGHSILGEEKSLKSFTREAILQFIGNNYHTNEMVISSVGSIPFEKLVKLAERYFGNQPARLHKRAESFTDNYKIFYKTVEKNTFQVHCVMGNLAFNIKDEKRYALYLLNNLLGGPGLNSRLNMSLREKNGYAYNVDSTYNAYIDTGIINIYFGTDKKDLKKCTGIVSKELSRLKNQTLSRMQLLKAKKQLTGHMAISLEINENLMFSAGKSMLVFNKVDTLKTVTERIELITSDLLVEVAHEIFNPEKISYLIYV